jgi:excisionase family DNA binding protein
MDRVLTRLEAAEALRITDQTLRTLTRRGEIEGYQVGRQWRYNQSDIEAFKKRRQQEAKKKMLRRVSSPA